jgi:hypothetical protein
MLRRLGLGAILLVAVPLCPQEPPRAHLSLRLSCFKRPFLSIDVSSVHRDTFPPIELMLRDPKGRTIGAGSSGKRIPHSQYGRVDQVPEKPKRSSVIAAEVCDAVQGDYEVILRELDSGSEYGLSVAVDDGKNGNAARGSSYVTRSRVCRFGMRIKFEYGNALVYWLDGSGITTERPPCLGSAVLKKKSD